MCWFWGIFTDRAVASVQNGEDVDAEWDLLEAEERELSAWRMHFGEAARAELMANGNARVRV